MNNPIFKCEYRYNGQTILLEGKTSAYLDADYSLRSNRNIFFAGQMTGVEGYVESASSGFVAGLNAARLSLGQELIDFPPITAIGALAHYISDKNVVNFQPMNVNYGLLTPLGYRIKGKANKNLAIANRSLAIIDELKNKGI